MEIYDVIVVGGGCAGASAGMYSARFNMNTLVFAEQPGGLITTTHLVENYPGIKKISGPEMGQVFMEHAMEAGANFDFSRVNTIEKVEHEGKPVFKLQAGKKDYFAWTVTLATGTKHKHLGAPGEEEYANKGVSYCALCDAAFFKDKTCAIVGGGDSAAIEANIMSQFCAKVYVLVRKDFMRAEPVNLDRIEKDPKVEIKYLTEVDSIEGDGDKVTHVKLKDGSDLPLDGVFMAIGHEPQNDLAKQIGAEINDRGDVVVNREAETNIPGFYAAGDITNAKFKQAIIGAAEGVYASVMSYEYLQELGLDDR
jgi:thioredoxin reductase (NADPH)